jgi:hypothetical protein
MPVKGKSIFSFLASNAVIMNENRKVRRYLAKIPDIERCGSVNFWYDFLGDSPTPCCPFTHAAVAHGLVYEKGKGGSIRKALEFGIPQEVRMMYMQVWDKGVEQGVPKREVHELALIAAEAVEDSFICSI